MPCWRLQRDIPLAFQKSCPSSVSLMWICLLCDQVVGSYALSVYLFAHQASWLDIAICQPVRTICLENEQENVRLCTMQCSKPAACDRPYKLYAKSQDFLMMHIRLTEEIANWTSMNLIIRNGKTQSPRQWKVYVSHDYRKPKPKCFKLWFRFVLARQALQSYKAAITTAYCCRLASFFATWLMMTHAVWTLVAKPHLWWSSHPITCMEDSVVWRRSICYQWSQAYRTTASWIFQHLRNCMDALNLTLCPA